MALGTSSHEPNPQMPAPGQQRPAAAPKAEDIVVDPVHLLRLYGDKADSIKEMHALAVKAGAEALKSAEAAEASQQQKIEPVAEGAAMKA